MTTRTAPEKVAAQKSWLWLAFAWGFAEATVFFIAPDVLLTRLALRSFRRALIACVSALAGALLGGFVLWFAAQHGAAPRLLHTLTVVPGINYDLIARTGQAMHGRGVNVLFPGEVIGQPYKLFAIHAGAQEVPLLKFMLASAAARFSRFAFATTLAWAAGRAFRDAPEAVLARWHALLWLAVYLIYFIAIT